MSESTESAAPKMTTIAALVGVAQSTVSRALKDDPRISIATRKRIQKVANELDYRPNPLVSALIASRRAPESKSGAKTIAYITDYESPDDWANKPTCVNSFSGSTKRARELGFHLERFHLPQLQYNGERLIRILKSRGILGLCFGLSTDAYSAFSMDTDRFASVAIASYFPKMDTDRVESHALFNVRLAIDRLRSRGRRRIGLVVPEYNNRLANGYWVAGFLEDNFRRSDHERCNPLVIDRPTPTFSVFESWFRRERPDAIVVYKAELLPLIRKMGLTVPEDLSLAYLLRGVEEPRFAGVDPNYYQSGAATIDLLAEKLSFYDFRATRFGKVTLVKGNWRDGETA